MKNQHFVYALDLGTYDEDGVSLRKFGISSTETFAGRCAAFQVTAIEPPRLCGVILCDNTEHAVDVEKAVLSRLYKGSIESLPDSEMRRGVPDVLEFIESEMIDGEEFLGMDTGEWVKSRKRETDRKYKDSRRERQRELRKNPDYVERERRYRNRPDVKEREKNYRNNPDVKKRQKKHNSKPEIKARRNEQERKRRERKKRGGNSPGQTSFL